MDPKSFDSTPAACRYLMHALLQRLNKAQPGLVTDMRAGVLADRDAIAVAGALTAPMQATVAEALHILESAQRNDELVPS